MIYLRLKEERERLGLTQPALAEVASAGKRTVIDWEKGVSSPTAVQLAAMASEGVDVLFVLTGRRSESAAEVELLPSDERVLIDAYRRCAPEAKRNLIQTAALLSAGLVSGTSESDQPGAQSVKGDNNIQIGSVGSKARIKNR